MRMPNVAGAEFRQHDSAGLGSVRRRNNQQSLLWIFCLNDCPSAVLAVLAPPIEMGNITCGLNLLDRLGASFLRVWGNHQKPFHQGFNLCYLRSIIRLTMVVEPNSRR